MLSSREVVVLAGKQLRSSENRKNQSLPPLNVFSDDDPETARLVAQMARHLDTTVNYTGNKDFPMAELAYKYGNPLLRVDQLPHLQTQMRRLHNWYLQASAEGSIMLITSIRDEHHFRGNDEIHIEFEELFQLFNQDAIDKSLASYYC
jgi:hypothetical protein